MQRLDGRTILHVARQPQSAPAALFDFGSNFVHLLTAAGSRDYVGAGVGQAKCDSVAQTGGPAGDDGDPAAQIKKLHLSALLIHSGRRRLWAKTSLAPVRRASSPARRIYHVKGIYL